ncbi:MAG: sigma-54 dependent transcriptional regulator [Planctomycetota bacterium]|nr:sigma-54 dependent transcriptional regulator [Planctomycetota bacterium]
MTNERTVEKSTILLVDDEMALLEIYQSKISGWGNYQVLTESDPTNVVNILKSRSVDLIISDMEMPRLRGDVLHEDVNAFDPSIQFIILSSVLKDHREGLIRKGIRAIVDKIDPDEVLREQILRALVIRHEMLDLRNPSLPTSKIIQSDPQMVKVFNTVKQVAKIPSPVLIQGEPGTGKELVAHEVHRQRNRRLKLEMPGFSEKEHPYLAVNCGALSRTLLESQLFGHKKGAFTGSLSDQDGLFIAAKRGTLFLDEITELDLDLQVKLLRALQEKEVTPVGSTKALKIHARVIAATNRPIQELVREGKFRADLYYRIHVVNIMVPPLRERESDIEELAKHFSKEVAKNYNWNGAPRKLTPDALKLLKSYSWPGNVRELNNVIERSFALGDGGPIQPHDLPEEIRQAGSGLEAGLAGFKAPISAVGDSMAAGSQFSHPTRGEFPTFDEVVAEHIRRALIHTRGVKSRAATLLSIDRNRLYRLMSKYQIPAEGETVE